MKWFLTGSRAYGTPRPDSDVDVCVFATESERVVLRQNADSSDFEDRRAMHRSDPRYDFDEDGLPTSDPGESLKFGKLNLICVPSLIHFEAWRTATVALAVRAPVTRNEAIAEIRKCLKEVL